AEAAGADAAAATAAAAALAGGVTDVGGTVVAMGRTDRWCAWPPLGGDETTTFSGGGEAERAPIDGRCTVPESRSSAIAAEPMSSGISGAATRRAAAQTASHFARLLADTASLLHFLGWDSLG